MLDRTEFFVKEHVGLLKARDAFDILDLDSQEKIGEVSETTPGWVIGLRLVVNKQMLPKRIEIKDVNSETPVCTLEKGMSFFVSKVFIIDQAGEKRGYLKSKVFSLGGGFHVFDMNNQKVADIKGDWKGWNFKMLDSSGAELGTIAKKWGGLAKEMFTSADNYVIALNDEGATRGNGVKIMLLAAGIAIDTVFKERA